MATKPFLLNSSVSSCSSIDLRNNKMESTSHHPISIVIDEPKDEADTVIPMWKKLTMQQTNQVFPKDHKFPSSKVRFKQREVIRASKTMTNQEFLAVGIMEGNLEKVKHVLKAYDQLFGSHSFHITNNFLYEICERYEGNCFN